MSPLNTRTYNSQSGFSLRIKGTKKTTYLYLGDQWDSNSLWESRYIWLPIEIDDRKKTLDVVWYDVYDLNAKTGEYKGIIGKSYYGKDATVAGNAFKQEAVSSVFGETPFEARTDEKQNFASGGVIVTGIYGNDSSVTFEGIEGTGKPQWVSFYYQSRSSARVTYSAAVTNSFQTQTTWDSAISVSHLSIPIYLIRH